jgi:soluble lytic murein transglycosylase-like protein
MANLNIKIPAVFQSYYNETQAKQVKTNISQIKAKYNQYVSNIAKITKVPEELIYSFIFIESAGNESAVNKSSGATGLMQLALISTTEILNKEFRLNRMTNAEREILVKYLGEDKVNKIQKMKQGAKEFYVTKQDLLNPELNILIGAIYLGILIDEESKTGTPRLDKVVLRYNRGYYYANRGRDIKGDINNVLATVTGESKNFITKLLGTNGTLDILIA